MLIGQSQSAYVQHHHHHHHETRPLASQLAFPEEGYIKAVNSGEGFVSVGWRFAPTHVFDWLKIRQLIVSIKSERLKAVFITNKGIFSYNKTADGIEERALDEYLESRIEIIAQSENETWQEDILACLAS